MARRKKHVCNKLIRKRVKYFFITCVLLFTYLTYRIFNITILKNEEYESKIESQSIETVNLNSGRGIIYDRNNVPLTDSKKTKVLLVPKKVVSGNFSNISLIKDATKLTEEDIYKAVQSQLSSEIIEIEIDYIDNSKIEALEEKGILVKEKTMRYSDDNLLTHLIGYVKKSENSGVSGIEKYMDDELKDSNKNYVSVFKAGQNKGGLTYLKGSVENISQNEDSKHLKLTIDSKIQNNIEQIMDKEENPSAVVISDIQTGEIISMCSRPNFNPNDISSYSNSSKGELQNRVLSVTYPPGSVFKLVVLFAALDNNIIDENYIYNCTGSTKVGSGGEVLNCNNLTVHGRETLEEAVANSCNTAFYDIAKRVGSEKIFDAIKILHLDEKVDIGIEEEKNSKIPKDIALSNLAIGQDKIEFTPLQINQMTQIIANNGTYKPLYVYDSIINNNKDILKTYKSNKKEEIISPYTMTQIKRLMTSVSLIGTAKTLSDLEGGCGVKTGTAQSSLNGKPISHGWITGFYPRENPKYAITVVVEGTEESSKSAVPIFKDICQKLK
ncbi:peptidoglycan D,D-transpeptidase FtsI family protein [Terrisporobacter sp.]|uniref:peptidoglycan D,D-transpeptidase FtsI family protein n=1 Tax=Terrisporobacter sp. TaxID=1965305 RepID=UPI00260CEDD7|nr:penicillin-binding protein 2 [Terrisporobacter sp.]